MSELKPCPFCGGNVTHVFTNHKSLQCRDFQYYCSNCGATVFLTSKTKYESVEKIETEVVNTWNRRTNNAKTD